MVWKRLAVVALALPAWLATSGAYGADMLRVYFGTNTQKESKGIYFSTLDLATGKLTPPELAAETKNPTFLALASSGKTLYAVSEVEGGGAVSAFKVDSGGKLSLINSQPSGGKGPCHVSINEKANVVMVANYQSGSVASLPIGENGALKPAATVIQHEGKSIDPKRQDGPHAHSINSSADGRFAFAADLGIDKIMVYKVAPTGQLSASTPPATEIKPGSGPRHFAFHPDGKHAFIINEMANTITVLTFDAQAGTLTPGQTVSTLPTDFTGDNTTSEIVVHPSGKFVYGANRGLDSVAAFTFDASSGKLESIGQTPAAGSIPRNIAIDPTGQYLLTANQKSSTVGVFRIDSSSGKPTQVGEATKVPVPMCIRFLKFAH